MKKRKTISRIIIDIGDKDLQRVDKNGLWLRTETGSFSHYLKINNRLGCKIITEAYYIAQYTISDLYKSPQWKDAVREYKLLVQAYPSKITPKPYAVIPVKYMGAWCPGIFMQHIPGEYPKVHTGSMGKILGKMGVVFKKLQEKLNKVGLRHKDLHELNVLKYGQRTYRVIDFTPTYITRIRLTKK